jgi:hypothetical protein
LNLSRPFLTGAGAGAGLFALLLGTAAAAQTAKLVAGTYRQIDTVTKRALIPGNQIVVVAAKGGRVAFSVSAMRQTDAGLGSVVGVIPAVLPATWSQSSEAGNCRLTFENVPHGIRVVQDAGFGDCGFGTGISATGTYQLVAEKPL